MKIVILGTGKIGSWLVNLLSEEHRLAVYDIDRERLKGFDKSLVLSELCDIKNFEPDLLINAVSLQNTIEAFEKIIKYLPQSCILSDVASIKGEIPEYYKKSGFRFASVHPMFGPTHVNMKKVKDENAIIIKESDEEIKNFYKKLFTDLDLNIFEYSFVEHDEMMAYSLTTPFVSSLVFAACIDNTVVPGTNFGRHKKIAEGLLAEDDKLLMEILFSLHSLPQLDKITSRLEFLKHIIKEKDQEEAKRFFEGLRKNLI